MTLPREFTSIANLELAFDRIERSQRKDYKEHTKHFCQAFRVTKAANLKYIAGELQSEIYVPSTPRVVYLPKKSGILRPITILCMKDAIVYQAIVNYISNFFRQEQKILAGNKCFGAILGAPRGKHFFRSWRRNYAQFNEKVTSSFHEGYEWIADFDLVAFYELIDHHLLSNILKRYIKSQMILKLLTRCLDKWNTKKTGASLHHGIPQGPDASAFLAECVLFNFDRAEFQNVRYYRYIDDIKLMAHNESDIKRALRHLDILTKEYGLVPQAQKIEIRKAENKSQIIKNIPSDLLRTIDETESNQTKRKQKILLKKLRESIKTEYGSLVIKSDTIFRYSLLRSPARIDILKRIAPLLLLRPDLSWVLSSYLRRFKDSPHALEILRNAICQDPIYDRAASDYVEVFDFLNGPELSDEINSIIETTHARCPENGVALKVAVGTFFGRRRGKAAACTIVRQEKDPLVKSLLLHGLFLKDSPKTTHSIQDCRSLLENIVIKNKKDEDLARYCLIYLLKLGWQPSKNDDYSASVRITLMELGLLRKKRISSFAEIIHWFFFSQGRVNIAVKWAKVLSHSGLKSAAQRCLRILELTDPSAKIMILDTFNEILIQEISRKHSTLVGPYQLAAQNNRKLAGKHPDFGNWLNNGPFQGFFPKGSSIFREIHDARLETDLAHGRHKKGTGTNAKIRMTKPISFERVDFLFRKCRIAWAELLLAFQSLS